MWATNGIPGGASGRIGRFLDDATNATFDALCTELGARFATGQDAGLAVDAFLADGDNVSERRDRYATIRVLEKLSGVPVKAASRPDWVGPAFEQRRPLTRLEATLVRVCAHATIRKTAIIGFAEAGASSGELHLILPTDVTIDNLQASHLAARGTERSVRSGYPIATPRQLAIPSWCQQSIGEMATTALNAQSLLYRGEATDAQDRQSSVLMTFGSVLADAGLNQDPTVTPQSIRNTAALDRYRSDGIEAASQLLGIDDLNFVLREIGVRPHSAPRTL